MEKSSLISAVLLIEEWEYCWDLYKMKKEGRISLKHFKTYYTSALKRQQHEESSVLNEESSAPNEVTPYLIKVNVIHNEKE